MARNSAMSINMPSTSILCSQGVASTIPASCNDFSDESTPAISATRASSSQTAARSDDQHITSLAKARP